MAWGSDSIEVRALGASLGADVTDEDGSTELATWAAAVAAASCRLRRLFWRLSRLREAAVGAEGARLADERSCEARDDDERNPASTAHAATNDAGWSRNRILTPPGNSRTAHPMGVPPARERTSRAPWGGASCRAEVACLHCASTLRERERRRAKAEEERRASVQAKRRLIVKMSGCG